MSVDYDNDWFLNFAPVAYRETRAQATQQIELALERTAKLVALRMVVGHARTVLS